jgi:hypothetical protein
VGEVPEVEGGMTSEADFRFVALWEYDQRARLSEEQYQLMQGFLAWMGEHYTLVKREE